MNLNENQAALSARWLSEEKLSFLWERELIIAHYDRDRHLVYIITFLSDDKKVQVGEWLKNFLTKKKTIVEGDPSAEQDRY